MVPNKHDNREVIKIEATTWKTFSFTHRAISACPNSSAILSRISSPNPGTLGPLDEMVVFSFGIKVVDEIGVPFVVDVKTCAFSSILDDDDSKADFLRQFPRILQSPEPPLCVEVAKETIKDTKKVINIPPWTIMIK